MLIMLLSNYLWRRYNCSINNIRFKHEAFNSLDGVHRDNLFNCSTAIRQ